MVLFGGGVRGVVYIGVLWVLVEKGIEVDVFSGISVGVIVVIWYFVGLSIE